MEDIHDDIALRKAAIIFASHHGRKSGMLPQTWLDDLETKVIVVGEAPSEHLEYYKNFDTIKQNSAGDVTFDCDGSKVHVYCSVKGYAEDFLDDEGLLDGAWWVLRWNSEPLTTSHYRLTLTQTSEPRKSR